MSIRFLVPTNFEDYTINALRYCILLAGKFDAEIMVFHAFRPICEENILNQEDNNIFNTQQEAEAKINDIIQLCLSETTNKDCQIIKKITEGYAEDLIPAVVKEYVPKLIVMGTKSKGETIKELLGSITFDIITSISVPVLVIPKDYNGNINKLKNILFLTNFTQGEYTSLHKLIELVLSLNVIIHCVQHCPEGKNQEVKKIKELNEYINYCASTYRNQHIEYEYMYAKNIIEGTIEYIQNNKIDLLAIISKKQNFLSKILHPCITKTMLFNLEIPMLFFHQ